MPQNRRGGGWRPRTAATHCLRLFPHVAGLSRLSSAMALLLIAFAARPAAQRLLTMPLLIAATQCLSVASLCPSSPPRSEAARCHPLPLLCCSEPFVANPPQRIPAHGHSVAYLSPATPLLCCAVLFTAYLSLSQSLRIQTGPCRSSATGRCLAAFHSPGTP